MLNQQTITLALFLAMGVVLVTGLVAISEVEDKGLLQKAEAQEDDCSEPEDYNDQFLIERCNDGAYMINKETGEKNWAGTAGGLGKACDTTETGLEFCIATPP